MLSEPRTKVVELGDGCQVGDQRVDRLTLRVPTAADEAAAAKVEGESLIVRRLAVVQACVVDGDAPSLDELLALTRRDGRQLLKALRELENEDVERALATLKGEFSSETSERVEQLASLIALHRATGITWEMLLAMTAEERAMLHAAVKRLNDA